MIRTGRRPISPRRSSRQLAAHRRGLLLRRQRPGVGDEALSLAQVIGAGLVLAACVIGLHLLPLGVAKLDLWLATPSLTPNDLRRITGLGAEWQVIQVGADGGAEVPHRRRGLHGLRAAARTVAVRLPFVPTPTSGVAVAECPACRTAWVRVGGP